MADQFQRTRMLLGDEAINRLKQSRVILFGVGGVGGGAAEALARAGVGHIELVDNDTVSLTNLNRQLVALHSTVGRKKTEVMAERIRDINPDAEVVTHDVFYTADTADLFDLTHYDYVLDAIDTVSAKLILADLCYKSGTKLISSMGTGNKIDPTKLTVSDINKTSGDPLARVMRRELKKRGIPKLKVVYSLEEPRTPVMEAGEQTTKRAVPASISFVPPVAGMIMAGEAIKDLIRDLI
jgi:tRNA A37 threonylcarbamoyladenosine dehydratase